MGVSEALAINKFRLYSMLDNKEKAYEEIQQIIDKNSGDIRYLILMGDLYADDNQLDKAKGYYDQAKLIDPDYPALILSFVNYYEKTGSSDAAQTEIKKQSQVHQWRLIQRFSYLRDTCLFFSKIRKISKRQTHCFSLYLNNIPTILN